MSTPGQAGASLRSVAGRQGRREATLLLCGFLLACAIAAGIATRDLGVPGVYDDEVVQAVPAAAFLDPRVVPISIPESRAFWLFGRSFPLMTQPYMGALKSQALIPVFAVFGATPTVLRLATLAWSALGLVLTVLWASRLFGLSTALAAGSLLVLDPSFLWISRHDFGSFALGFLARAGGLYLLTVGWMEGSRARLFAGGLCLALGLYNKIDFAVFLAAAGIALVVAAPKIVTDAFRSGRTRLLPEVLGFVVGLLPLVPAAPGVLAAARWGYETRDVGPVGWSDKLQTLTSTLDGSHFHSLMQSGGVFRQMFGGGEVASPFLAIVVACTLAMAAWIVASARHGGCPRARAFVLVAAVLTSLGILLTPRAIRIHHVMNVYPLPHLVVGLVAVALWKAGGSGLRRAAPAAGLLVLGVALSGHIFVNLRIAETLRATGGKGLWSEAREAFARELLESAPRPVVVALDWGFYWSMEFVSPDLRVLLPIWEIEGKHNRLREERDRVRRALGLALGDFTWSYQGSPQHVYLVFPPEYANFRYGASLLKGVSELPPEAVGVRYHRDRQGDVAFLSVRIMRPHQLVDSGDRFKISLE